MSTIHVLFKKAVAAAAVVALGWAALPAMAVHAAGPAEPPIPPAQLPADRLERIWAKEQAAYERVGRFLDRADQMIEKAQELIDKANENGKDTAAVQAALDAFADAVKRAHPVYESGKGILASHQGFDEVGKVTDVVKAAQTVKDMGAKLREIRQIIGGPYKALREAIQAFREANKPLQPPAGQGR